MFNREKKLGLALALVWPRDAVEEYFDVDPGEAIKRAAIGDEIERFELERQLQHEGLISLDWLALKFGVTKASLERALRSPRAGEPPFPLETFKTGGHYLLPEKVAEAWVKQYLLPRHKTWSSLGARAHDLAGAIGGEVRSCAVSLRFGETPAAVATCRCVVTWDDVSRAHQEYLDNSKPLSLEPDHVGWHAIHDGFDRAKLFRPSSSNMDQYLQQHLKAVG